MEVIKKYWYYVVIVGFIISTIYTCTNNKEYELRGQVKELNKQLEKSTKGLQEFRVKQKNLFDSISVAEKIKNSRLSELKKSNDDLNKQLDSSRKKLEQTKQAFRNKTYEELAKVFKESGYKNITSTNNSVNLEKDTPVNVLEDLVEGKNCSEDLLIKDSIIENKNEEIKIVNEKLVNRDIQIESKNQEALKLDESLQISREINKKQEKENRQLRKKNFLTKYVITPLAVLATILIIK